MLAFELEERPQSFGRVLIGILEEAGETAVVFGGLPVLLELDGASNGASERLLEAFGLPLSLLGVIKVVLSLDLLEFSSNGSSL